MDTKQFVPWALALTFAVLASTQVLEARAGQKGQALGGTPKPAKPEVVKWEYKWEPKELSSAGTISDAIKEMNFQGGTGWELAAVMPYGTKASNNGELGVTILIFKRPL